MYTYINTYTNINAYNLVLVLSLNIFKNNNSEQTRFWTEI